MGQFVCHEASKIHNDSVLKVVSVPSTSLELDSKLVKAKLLEVNTVMKMILTSHDFKIVGIKMMQESFPGQIRRYIGILQLIFKMKF